MRRVLMAVYVGATMLTGAAQAADKIATPVAAKSQPVITADRPRVAYVAFRILELERSLKFYQDILGMQERQRIPLDNGVMEILLGYGDANKDAGVLLLYNPNHKEPYTHGDGFHRFIISVKDLPALIAHVKAAGGKVMRGPIRVDNLKLSYAFISDPDGYQIELVEND